MLRQRMINVGLKKGLNHAHTIEISQILDIYLTDLQNRKNQIRTSVT
ncbi:aspartyl-phosphate phosphatase Spo0E family protein [Pontibacillus marinus]